MRRLLRIVISAIAATFAVLSYLWVTLPDVRPLRTANPATTAFIELRAREARRRGEAPRRVQQWVRYDRISQHLKRAVLVAEDSGFWEHEGVDVDSLRESVELNIEKGAFIRGGSTITQQLAKNLYLSPSRNPLRKLRELVIARRLEAELPKRRILELYLNVIEWGDGVYGAEAAARTYFSEPASAINPDQAALLAGAIINPRVYSPARPNARLRARLRLIRARMGDKTPPAALPANAPQPGEVLVPIRGLPIPVEPITLPQPFPTPPTETTTTTTTPENPLPPSTSTSTTSIALPRSRR
jgi:monofunctional biosynthetic peptidoglycan transglycosylase